MRVYEHAVTMLDNGSFIIFFKIVVIEFENCFVISTWFQPCATVLLPVRYQGRFYLPQSVVTFQGKIHQEQTLLHRVSVHSNRIEKVVCLFLLANSFVLLRE